MFHVRNVQTVVGGTGLLLLLLVGLMVGSGCDSSTPVTNDGADNAISGLDGNASGYRGTMGERGLGKKDINPRQKIHPFQGITETDEVGNIISVDPDDWCYATEPGVYAFLPAYPNPTEGACTLTFVLPEAADVNIMITKWVGDPIRIVRRLVNGEYAAGTHTVVWDGRDDDGDLLGADVYRVLMTAGDFTCYGDVQIVEP